MAWNFCPDCGHRVYQHGDGCEHVDVETKPCPNPDTCSTSPDAHCHPHRIPCDCTRGFEQLVSP